MSDLTPPVSANDHAHGPEDAPVTLVEYGDFQCPDCGYAYEVVAELERRMGRRLRFVFRNFPLTDIHRHAEAAAEASEAAAAQGKFWEMYALLFQNQQALRDKDLEQYAVEIGLDLNRFREELADHPHASRIKQSLASGLRSGVQGTPTFFINGTRYEDSYDLETLGAAIERAAE